MGTIKNAIYKIDNGTDFDEIHFKTNSDQVMCGSTTLTSQLEHIATKINMTSEDGTNWVLYIDNYGQLGVIKEV